MERLSIYVRRVKVYKAIKNAYVIRQQSIRVKIFHTEKMIFFKLDFFKFRVKSSNTTKMPENV